MNVFWQPLEVSAVTAHATSILDLEGPLQQTLLCSWAFLGSCFQLILGRLAQNASCLPEHGSFAISAVALLQPKLGGPWLMLRGQHALCHLRSKFFAAGGFRMVVLKIAVGESISSCKL